MVKKIVVLAFDGAQMLDITGPIEVFSEACIFAGRPIDPDNPSDDYAIQCIALDSGSIAMSNGLEITAISYRDIELPIDTLIIPGGTETGMRALALERDFLQWLSKAIPKSRRVVSVCTGAFILANLGVLNGRRVCTHWGACKSLQQLAPEVHVDANALFKRDGCFYTSAGVTAGIDLALALVEEDLGNEIAGAIARNLVLYLRRPGGQAQFSQPLLAQYRATGKLRDVLDFIASNPAADLNLEILADRAAMSPRSFSRTFQKELGKTPGAYVREYRLGLAGQLLSTTETTLKELARRIGFSSVDIFSRAFVRHFGLRPDTYRKRFSSTKRSAQQ